VPRSSYSQARTVFFWPRHRVNKNATAMKLSFDNPARWKPWKALLAAFGAGIAVASGLIAVIAWVLSHFVRWGGT
jgi:hypothetical protein